MRIGAVFERANNAYNRPRYLAIKTMIKTNSRTEDRHFRTSSQLRGTSGNFQWRAMFKDGLHNLAAI